MEILPPHMMFKRDPMLTSWSALLQRLDYVHLTQGSDEF
jgi:hypothetical protein